MCRKLLLSYRVLRTEIKKLCYICSIIYHKNNISFIVLKKYIALAQFLLTSSGGYIQCFLSLSIKMPDLEEIAVHKIIHFAVRFLTRPELRNFLIEITVISTMLFSGATIFCLSPVWLLFPYRHHPCNRHQAHCDYLLTLRSQISNLPLEPAVIHLWEDMFLEEDHYLQNGIAVMDTSMRMAKFWYTHKHICLIIWLSAAKVRTLSACSNWKTKTFA